ncbi:uncharacterized protein KQ657_002503 [Scheffersomyces spartinae]|uniref:tRNA(Ile)-lysidine synthetase n=1 Tax=Scheffersomyces spartinae TaxID=45513 RepID=A0A9P7V6E9_9ASCO|nr:uncharacterized protein KQ657_002503 [Scheffersomyces spartinae]KAG7192138.1 hypothetical protein KQ657_002503 [Scheffersomyces spartinae]
MCLTYLLSHLPNRQYQVHAVTIDHKYRENSGLEAARVGDIVSKWGVKHIIKPLEYEQEDVNSISNFEEVAREMRYQVFRDVCKEKGSNLLFTGHNMNDKLETFVQRLGQNSTLYGLMGIRPVSRFPLAPKVPTDNITVVRPLLEYFKSDIRDMAVNKHLEWFEDHTNKDIHLTQRNLIRYWMEENLLDMNNVHSLYCQLEECNDMIESKVEQLSNYILQFGSLTTNRMLCLVSFQLPKLVFNNPNYITILSRYLYQLLEPYSSVKYYHWMYAKLERSVVPRLFSHTSTITITALNLKFTLVPEQEEDTIRLLISRQNMEKHTYQDNQFNIHLRDSEWSNWVFYDRRLWIRVRLQIPVHLQLAPYCHKIHGKYLTQKLNVKGKALESLPIIVNFNGDIIAIPGAGLRNEAYDYVDYEIE